MSICKMHFHGARIFVTTRNAVLSGLFFALPRWSNISVDPGASTHTHLAEHTPLVAYEAGECADDFCGAKTDWFVDPFDGTVAKNAPILLFLD
jgi:hypothetical protein